MDDDLESLMRRVYGAYHYLMTHDLIAESTTSRLLHDPQPEYLAARVNDEIGELAGAVAGTHRHGGGADDVILEASQALYWSFLLAVGADDAYDALAPHRVFMESDSRGVREDEKDETRPTLSSRHLLDQAGRRQFLDEALGRIRTLSRRAEVPVIEAVRRDMADLQSKPYLADYWRDDELSRGVEARVTMSAVDADE